MEDQRADEWLLVASFFFFLLGGLGAVMASKNPRIANGVSHSGGFLDGISGALVSLHALFLQKTISISAWHVVPEVVLSFRVDDLSAFFLLLISVLAITVSIYSSGYVKAYYGKKNVGLLGMGFNLFLLSMVAVVTVDNGLTFLLAWELMSLVSFLLVMFEHEKPDVRKAGFVYIVMNGLHSPLIFGLIPQRFQFPIHSIQQNSHQLSASIRNLIFLHGLRRFWHESRHHSPSYLVPRAHPAAPSH